MPRLFRWRWSLGSGCFHRFRSKLTKPRSKNLRALQHQLRSPHEVQLPALGQVSAHQQLNLVVWLRPKPPDRNHTGLACRGLVLQEEFPTLSPGDQRKQLGPSHWWCCLFFQHQTLWCSAAVVSSLWSGVALLLPFQVQSLFLPLTKMKLNILSPPLPRSSVAYFLFSCYFSTYIVQGWPVIVPKLFYWNNPNQQQDPGSLFWTIEGMLPVYMMILTEGTNAQEAGHKQWSSDFSFSSSK